MIDVETFWKARKAVADSPSVFAHGLGWPPGDWNQVLDIKAIHGAFFARFIPSAGADETWTQIDGLEVR